MKILQVDVAVIGAGSAGHVAYRAAKSAGARAVIIEGGEYGTTCARAGCMPSKLLIAAADAAHAVRKAPAFGVHVDGAVSINGRDVMERVRRERDRFVAFMVRDMLSFPEADRIRGSASFLDDHTLQVSENIRITAKSTVIATGSRPANLATATALGDRLITSEDVFNWHDLPTSVAVIGTGSIGLELGQALHRLGVQVVVFGRGGRVGPLGDPEISDGALAIFNEEFTLLADAHIASIQRDGAKAAIRYTDAAGSPITRYFDYVLAAIGRTPNVMDIGLNRTTLKLDNKGAPLFDPLTARTVSKGGDSPIFIAGDASNFIPLQHEAADEGRIAGRNAAHFALGKQVNPGLRRARMGVIFTDPQIGIVGGGFHSLKPGSFVTGQVNFEDQGRARILMKNKGLMHVYADVLNGHFLGAEMLAPGAEHLTHLLCWALQNNMTVGQILEMPFYHPVIEEGLRTALRDLDAKLRVAQANFSKAA